MSDEKQDVNPSNPDEKAALPFRDDSSERPLATNPWSSPTPDPKTHDPAADHEAREAGRAAQRDEHNQRVSPDIHGALPTQVVGDDGLEVFEDDEIADEEEGDAEDPATADLPTDEYDGSGDQVDHA